LQRNSRNEGTKGSFKEIERTLFEKRIRFVGSYKGI